MPKTDGSFVRSNLNALAKGSFKNAGRLFEDAKTLRRNGSFCSSLFLSISVLEELAKWNFLKNKNINYSKLEEITNHKNKINEILKIFIEITNNPKFKKDDSDWLKCDRIKEMREDVLYVRLNMQNSDKNYPIFPDEKYWQRRAKAMINLLEVIFRHFKRT
jgi:AbiV family abortive infection protein